MKLSDYVKIVEAGANITPPSGQKIGPSGPSNTPPAASGPSTNIKSLWPGKGARPEQGMTVGLRGTNGLPVPGEITQVDQSANGVKVKNPVTGQEEWHSNDDLEPFIANDAKPQPGIDKKIDGISMNQLGQMEESAELERLKVLSGISENCSAGATGAGSIAVAPAAIGNVKRRQPVEESPPPVEYKPKSAAKTVVGDTKPNQASGKLSADLAARGKKTASRINNGFKRQ